MKLCDTHRWFFALVLTVAAACTREGNTILVPDPDDVASTAPIVIVVYDPDALGDRSYNDLIYSGVEQVANKYELRTLQLSPIDVDEGRNYLDNIINQMAGATDNVRRLLIVVGSRYDEFVRSNNRRLEANTLSDLLYLETRDQLEGKGSTLYISYYGAMYKAGAIAPHFASDALLVLANKGSGLIAEAAKGFSDGFASDLFPIDGKKDIFTEYVSSDIDGGYTISQTAALNMINLYENQDKLNYGMVVPICGGAASVFSNLADSHGTFLFMGVDRTYSSASCPLSCVKRIDRAVAGTIDSWIMSGTMPKHQLLGLSDGYADAEVHPIHSLYDYFFNGTLTDQDLRNIHAAAVKKEAEYEK